MTASTAHKVELIVSATQTSTRTDEHKISVMNAGARNRPACLRPSTNPTQSNHLSKSKSAQPHSVGVFSGAKEQTLIHLLQFVSVSTKSTKRGPHLWLCNKLDACEPDLLRVRNEQGLLRQQTQHLTKIASHIVSDALVVSELWKPWSSAKTIKIPFLYPSAVTGQNIEEMVNFILVKNSHFSVALGAPHRVIYFLRST